MASGRGIAARVFESARAAVFCCVWALGVLISCAFRLADAQRAALGADPGGEAVDFGVGEQPFPGVEVVGEFFFRQRSVYVRVAGGAEWDGLLAAGAVVLAADAFVFVACAGDEVVRGEAKAGAATQTAGGIVGGAAGHDFPIAVRCAILCVRGRALRALPNAPGFGDGRWQNAIRYRLVRCVWRRARGTRGLSRP